MIVRRIRVEETGCRKLRIAPNLGDLSYAKGSFPTPYGVVSVSHTKESDGHIRTEYSAPEGVEVILAQP